MLACYQLRWSLWRHCPLGAECWASAEASCKLGLQTQPETLRSPSLILAHIIPPQPGKKKIYVVKFSHDCVMRDFHGTGHWSAGNVMRDFHGTGHWSAGNPFRHRYLHQGFRGSKLCKDNLSSQEQFFSTQHVHVDMVISNDVLKKGTRGSFQIWGKDHDLDVTVIQKTHSRWFWVDTECHWANISQGRYCISIPWIGRICTPRGTTTWLPNQLDHDLDSWTVPNLLHCKKEYEVLVNY
jgi:hypothetical protein